MDSVPAFRHRKFSLWCAAISNAMPARMQAVPIGVEIGDDPNVSQGSRPFLFETDDGKHTHFTKFDKI